MASLQTKSTLAGAELNKQSPPVGVLKIRCAQERRYGGLMQSTIHWGKWDTLKGDFVKSHSTFVYLNLLIFFLVNMLKLHFHCLHLVLDFLYFHSDSHLSQCLTQNDNCCDCLINLIMNLLLQCYWNEKTERFWRTPYKPSKNHQL